MASSTLNVVGSNLGLTSALSKSSPVLPRKEQVTSLSSVGINTGIGIQSDKPIPFIAPTWNTTNGLVASGGGVRNKIGGKFVSHNTPPPLNPKILMIAATLVVIVVIAK